MSLFMQREQEGNREQMNDELSIVSEILAQLPPPLKGEVGSIPKAVATGAIFKYAGRAGALFSLWCKNAAAQRMADELENAVANGRNVRGGIAILRPSHSRITTILPAKSD
jgi:hypothetical protein